ncbi:MAG: DUF2953 domain-containing protein [Firmicutes bacterium]|nr:DUF2953 domain-containing protein [Bacillota bacterium]
MIYPVIIIFTIILLLVFLAKFKVLLDYSKKGEDDKISLRLSSLGGLFKLEYEIPMADIWKLGIRSIKIYKGYKEKTKEKHIDIKELYDRYKHIKNIIKKYSNFTKRIKNYLIIDKRIIIEKFRLSIITGTEDAFQTGIISGVIWTLLGNIDSFISNNFRVLDKYFFIKPNYLEEVLEIDFLCIISIRVVHIIVVGLIFLITKIKEEFNDRRWFKWHSIQ